MNDRLAMLAAIHDLPGDDLPRLAYADWMEENGQPERAEFIRVHLAMEQTPRGTPEYRQLWEREVELIRTFKEEWFGTFRAKWSFYEVKRGFLDEIAANAPDVVPHATWLVENHAVQGLCVGSPNLEALETLLASPLVATLWQLRYLLVQPPGAVYYYEQSPALSGADLPLSQRPLDVGVPQFRAGVELARLLARSPHLGRMARLDLSGNRLGLAGTTQLLTALTHWPNLSALRVRAEQTRPQEGSRRIVGENLSPGGLVALVSHPLASQLRFLDISGEDLDAPACVALLDTPHLERLAQLWMTPPTPQLTPLTRNLRRRFSGRIQLVAGDR